MSGKHVGGLLPAAGVALLAGCVLGPLDTYYGAYSANCQFKNGDARSNLLDAGRATAEALGLTLKTTVDRPDETVAVVDLPSVAGASPYRGSSSGQIVFSRTAAAAAPSIAVVIFGSLKKDPQLIATARAAVEEELRRHGCAPWIFDNMRTVYF
jgi:hypothetical protein